ARHSAAPRSVIPRDAEHRERTESMRRLLRNPSSLKSRTSKRGGSPKAEHTVESLEQRLVLRAVIFDPDGSGSPPSPLSNVNTFDWQVGNSLSVGRVAAVTAFSTSGTQIPFDSFFQTRLAALLDGDGNLIATPGLNNNPAGSVNPYEITIVGG